MNSWTILVYLNGQNELGLEMESAFLSLKEMTISSNVTVVVEVGKASEEILHFIRGKLGYYAEPWVGVRRYICQDGQWSDWIQLNHVNQANEQHLLEFLNWGMSQYTAKRYMVIISGHGFLGDYLTDLQGESPYLMGAYEFCYALNQTKYPIDCLVLDLCYANTIELIYELDSNVKYILTYLLTGPLKGLNYPQLLTYFDDRPVDEILIELIEKTNQSLVAFKLNHETLQEIWSLSNELAYLDLFILGDEKNQKTREYLEKDHELDSKVRSLVIAYHSQDEHPVLLHFLYFNDFEIQDVTGFCKSYLKLAFTKYHYGRHLLMSLPLSIPPFGQPSQCTQDIFTLHGLTVIHHLYHKELTFNESKELVTDYWANHY